MQEGDDGETGRIVAQRPRLAQRAADHGAARPAGPALEPADLWELRAPPLTSRALRTACGEASPTVLQARLKELREAGLVELGEAGGYGLTALGRELCETVMPLHRFAERWRSKRRV